MKALMFHSMAICIGHYNFGAAETAISQLNGFKLEVRPILVMIARHG